MLNAVGWTCGWRIVIPPKIPEDSPSCYHSSMRNLAVLFLHFIAVLARLLGPGGVRSIVAESLLLKHQLLIVNRSRQRSPNLSASDRIFAGWMALLVRPTRLLRSAIALKPSTLLGLHYALSLSSLGSNCHSSSMPITKKTILRSPFSCSCPCSRSLSHHPSTIQFA
jgi:hypothetical protein